MLDQLHQSFAQLGEPFARPVIAKPLADARLRHINKDLIKQLQLQDLLADDHALADIAAGRCQGLAMKYSGHQFGVLNPELGDGRGLLLGEWPDVDGQLWDWHLKGAGPTPFSRFGDGRAVWRSSLREHVIGESLHALGIASSRSLCLASSSEVVMREQPEYAASIIRVARSHIRFGSFEEFFYQRQYPQLQELADYCLARYLPRAGSGDYAALLDMAVLNTAQMIAAWQAFGFNHGVMNTDNMSIIGETFDFGPFAFLDDYDPNFVCNHSDHHGRYRFAQQPNIGLWNLNALAHALSTLLDKDQLKQSLMRYQPALSTHYQTCMNQRLGLSGLSPEDVTLSQTWLDLLKDHQADYTLSFRALAHFLTEGQWPEHFIEFGQSQACQDWLQGYQQRITQQCPSETRAQMDSYNPLYLPRTHHLQRAIEDSQRGDDTTLHTLLRCVQSPFCAQEDDLDFNQPPPALDKGLCLSCSS